MRTRVPALGLTPTRRLGSDAVAPLKSRMASEVVVYTYAQCSTCRDAVKWLRARNVAFAEKPIRETPPSPAELRRMLAYQNGNVRRLINSSGQEYRALKLAGKISAMSESEVLALLAGNGRLVKRPFLLGANFGLVGFNEDAWAAAFRV